MAEQILQTTKPARKPRPKVRALKEYKPRLHVDLELAESLLQEMAAINRKALRVYDQFTDIVKWPVYHAAIADGIDSDVKTLLDATRNSLSDFVARSARQREEASNLMAVALSGLRILRANRHKSGQGVAQ